MLSLEPLVTPAEATDAALSQVAMLSQQLGHERIAFTDTLTALREQRNLHADDVVQLKAQLASFDRLIKQHTITLADRDQQIESLQARIAELDTRLAVGQSANVMAMSIPKAEAAHG